MTSWYQLEKQQLEGRTPEGSDAPSTQRWQRIVEDRVVLPPLPAAPPKRIPWRAFAWPLGAMAAAASIALFVALPRESNVKGGDRAVSLVRERDGSIAYDGDRFAAGDRFKVRFTCALGTALAYDVAVHQAGRTFYPLPPGHTICGNAVPLEGAVSLSGADAAQICVRAGREPPPRTDAIAGTCATLVP